MFPPISIICHYDIFCPYLLGSLMVLAFRIHSGWRFLTPMLPNRSARPLAFHSASHSSCSLQRGCLGNVPSLLPALVFTCSGLISWVADFSLDLICTHIYSQSDSCPPYIYPEDHQPGGDQRVIQDIFEVPLGKASRICDSSRRHR